MTSDSIRSFALGLLIAAGVCGLVYFTESSEEKNDGASQTRIETLSIDEMKNALVDEGYVIHTEAEWNEQLATAKSEENVDQEQNEEQLEQEKVISRTMISVSSGMTSIDVGKALEQTNIVESAFAFSKEVEKRGLSNALRPGMYEINSEMSLDEVISTIFQ